MTVKNDLQETIADKKKKRQGEKRVRESDRQRERTVTKKYIEIHIALISNDQSKPVWFTTDTHPLRQDLDWLNQVLDLQSQCSTVHDSSEGPKLYYCPSNETKKV